MLARSIYWSSRFQAMEVPEPQLPDSVHITRSDGFSTRDDLFVWFGSAVFRQ